MRRITHLSLKQPSTLELDYSDGTRATIDFSPLIRRGGAWSALADPHVFGLARIGDDGRSITWPNEIDFCADALWLIGQGEQRLAG